LRRTDIPGGKPQAVKAIGQIDFCHVHRAISWIGLANAKEEAFECSSKLHCFLHGTEAHRLVVNTPEGVVGDQAGTVVALGNDSQGREPQVVHGFDEAIGNEGPKAFFNELQHFLSDELEMIVAGLVGAPVEARLTELRAPGGCLHEDRDAVLAQALQQTNRRMAVR
jgi:hypothetical protein